ncbi:phage integrase family site-specific recombinase [Klebsiella pneumoniae]|uniref:tyrosine-type recombinase/integrase n=1 Tax=Klebsiella pneumoniae TaxID=573 RepID=UPI0010838E5A|nr:tyrosine-type recombinase/integrase [Klebsiella pneumoniae]MDZ8461981.1 tyrosine-type recombinase/integrase [Escherichia coli]HDS5083813.1 tyrosine-type recombinase/integrase [Klebsiella pneumoniae subsp. pneumoniae]EJD6543390.1 tyrosine-type recombinase/integrase [Klebsiella pneumoniae]ELA2355539.1 tyrosine-type recombinase/integrase [Klebsiella pneumoniae]ELA2397366.1 tyrosine-type recombinase/integrase [Klebsiella pneumoniae]
MAINHNQYLFQNRSGLWVFQIFVPKYMRHVFGHKRAWRKSTGTKDIVKARQFRNHLLIEFNKLKEKLKPDTEEKRISGAIASLYQEVSANNEIEDRRDKPAEVKTTSPTLCEIRDEYSENYKNRRSYSTLSKSARAVEVFLATIRETDIKIDIIGRRMVTQFIRTQQERVAGQTLQNWLTCLGSLYEFALRTYDAIPEGNPFHNHNLEARRTIESYEPFELVQMQKLLDAAEPEIKNIIVMGLFSGCRLDELASLKKSEIQTVEGVRCFYISKSKTKAGIRHVPIHSRLSAIVDEYLSHSYGEYLFPQANKINRADGKKGPFYSQAFTRLRRRVLPTATDRQCFHSLRGMFITCLDRAGVPEQRIGAITGHTEQKAKTEAFRTYSQGAGMKELSEYVELVGYEGLGV